MHDLNRFRWIARIEGLSFLFLLFVAMPLKYGFGVDAAVTYTGWLHGALFVWFGIELLLIWVGLRWPFGRVVLAGISSLIPFGTFWFEKKYL